MDPGLDGHSIIRIVAAGRALTPDGPAGVLTDDIR